MKKIGILSVMALLLLAVGVSAIPQTGFAFNKDVVVKGDWEWTGSWQKTYPATATYSYSVYSPLATVSSVDNYDNLGLAWKYAGQTKIKVNSPAQYVNNLKVWTVNNPATTPATGGYTRFDYFEQTKITDLDAKSKVTIGVSGYGKFNLFSQVDTDAESTQEIVTLVNQPTI